MCLGIPGQIVQLDGESDLAEADVVGVRRRINVGLLDDLDEGDWVLIHVGFAMDKIDEVEADRALQGLQTMGRDFDEEVDALKESRIE